MDKLKVWEKIGGLTLAAGAGGLVLWGVGTFFDLSKSDWAAWVQAVGSIGAIVGAVYVMDRQSEAAAKLAIDTEHRAMARRLSAIEGIVEHAFHLSMLVGAHTKPIENFYNYFFSYVDPTDLEAALASLHAIPVHTLESYKMVAAVQDLSLGVHKLVPFARIGFNTGEVHYQFSENDAFGVNFLCGRIREARHMFQESVIELGHSLSSRQAEGGVLTA
jgi:hypothetical protein